MQYHKMWTALPFKGRWVTFFVALFVLRSNTKWDSRAQQKSNGNLQNEDCLDNKCRGRCIKLWFPFAYRCLVRARTRW